MKIGSLLTTKPTMFLIVGLPGAGKTYTARLLSETFGAIHIESDVYRAELFDRTLRNEEQDDIVNRLGLIIIHQLLATGVNLVVDGNHFLKRDRKKLQQLTRSFSYNVLVVWVQTDVNISYQRASHKDRRKVDEKYSVAIDLETFNFLAERFQAPTEDKYVVISGRHLYKNQLNIIKKRMIELSMVPVWPDAPSHPTLSSGGQSSSPKRNRLTI